MIDKDTKCPSSVPEHIFWSIKNYVLYGIHTGSGLEAILCNKLLQSFENADDDTQADMFGILRYLYNHTPAGCWGSEEKYAAWLAKDWTSEREAT